MQALFLHKPTIFLATNYDEAMKKRTPSEVGIRITALREVIGLSQRRLAEKIAVPQSNIAYWERGASAPPGEIIPKLVETLGVSADELLGITSPKSKRVVAKGRLQQVFEAASHLPRRQQQKVAEFVEAFVNQHSNGHKQTA